MSNDNHHDNNLKRVTIEDNLISQTLHEIEQALNIPNTANPSDNDYTFLRRQYTLLLSEIYSKKKQAVNDPDNHSLITLIDKANKLVDLVNSTTAASLDSKILALTAELGAERISKMKSTGSLFDISEFVKLINGNLKKEEGNKKKEEILNRIGNRIALEWWNGAIVTREMLDDLISAKNKTKENENENEKGDGDGEEGQSDKKKTTPRKKKINKDVYILVRAQTMDAQTMAQQQISTLTECNKYVMETFEVLSQFDRIPYYKLIIDPNSFSRTVENQYYAAFLVHENWAKMSHDQKGNAIDSDRGEELWIEAVQSKEEKEELDGSHKKNQMIVTITFNKWREMIKRYKIKSALLKRE